MNKKQFEALAYKHGFEPRFSGKEDRYYLQKIKSDADAKAFEQAVKVDGRIPFTVVYV